jgi:hypothetical protein
VLGVLAVQAHRALRAHRETMERILRDYAGLAAANYVVRIEPELEHYAFLPAIAAIAETLDATGRLAEPRAIDVWTDDTTHLAIDLVQTNVVVPLGEGVARETPREQREGTVSETAPRMSGTMPDPEFSQWLADTLAAFARGEWRDEWKSAVIVRPASDARAGDGVASAPRIVVCAVRSDALDDARQADATASTAARPPRPANAAA